MINKTIFQVGGKDRIAFSPVDVSCEQFQNPKGSCLSLERFLFPIFPRILGALQWLQTECM